MTRQSKAHMFFLDLQSKEGSSLHFVAEIVKIKGSRRNITLYTVALLNPEICPFFLRIRAFDFITAKIDQVAQKSFKVCFPQKSKSNRLLSIRINFRFRDLILSCKRSTYSQGTSDIHCCQRQYHPQQQLILAIVEIELQ